LQYVAVRCSTLQCVVVQCIVLQYDAVRCSALQCIAVAAVRYNALQCFAMRCSALQCVAVRRSASQCVTACHSASQHLQQGQNTLHLHNVYRKHDCPGVHMSRCHTYRCLLQKKKTCVRGEYSAVAVQGDNIGARFDELRRRASKKKDTQKSAS